MTTNTADQLATLLRNWTVPVGSYPHTVRGFSGPDDLDAWRRHDQAAQLVRAVDFTLQGMDAMGIGVDMFVLAMPKWYAAVHFATTPWGQASSNGRARPACADTDIALLEALGLVIKTGQPIALTEGDRRTLTDILAEARTLLEEDGGEMPVNTRAYLWGLIVHAEQVLRDLDNQSTETVRQVALELGGALIVRGEQIDQAGDKPRGSKWRAAGHMLIGGFLSRGGEYALEGGTHLTKEAAKAIVKKVTEG